jgi:hypothetical protein
MLSKLKTLPNLSSGLQHRSREVRQDLVILRARDAFWFHYLCVYRKIFDFLIIRASKSRPVNI